MQIDFSQAESWSFDREGIILHAKADGKEVRCAIPQEFLTAPFAKLLTEEEARRLFRDRREEVELLLRQRIEAGDVGEAGEVILRR